MKIAKCKVNTVKCIAKQYKFMMAMGMLSLVIYHSEKETANGSEWADFRLGHL